MEQNEFDEKMNEVLRKKKRPKIIFFTVIGLFILYLIINGVIKNIKETNFKAEVESKELKNSIEWIININPDTVFAYSNLNTITYNYDLIKNSENLTIEEKQPLMNKIDSCKIKIKSGVIIDDEFNGTTIKDKTKFIVVTIKQYNNTSTPFVIHEAKGYANNINKKAHKIFQKHPTWGKDKCITIASGKVSMGMTTDMVVEAWGRPEDINRTVGSWGVHEQWVYSNNYLYFEDDILTSWQD